ncbi:hypothetical protein Salat_0166800 [Sesamum alatum]|uniref:CCHC-type domain-containing protein n=1 Tax=Sesamum alatum TaxID=300844 RepID=A0AAE1YXA9_9LAMI|nr:hypothetical protein Salat_0166800 [Sesamum alatum]
MEVQQLGGGRFLLQFNHFIDRNRALEGCPWSFEKNIIILNEIREHENPLRVNLDWCDFHVHVHELPLSMINLGVATLLGNRIGRFRDLDMDDSGCAWGATLRLCVAINVSRPLPRAIPICSTVGDELLVHLTYERLPNFCYFCGKLGHIAKYCELQFEDGFVDPGPEAPYRPWLRAPLPNRGRKFSQPQEPMGTSRSASVSGSGSLRGAAVFGGFSGLGQGTLAEHGGRTAPRGGGGPYVRCELQSREDDPAGLTRDTRGFSAGHWGRQRFGVGRLHDGTSRVGSKGAADSRCDAWAVESNMGDPGVEDSTECVPSTLHVHRPVGPLP